MGGYSATQRLYFCGLNSLFMLCPDILSVALAYVRVITHLTVKIRVAFYSPSLQFVFWSRDALPFRPAARKSLTRFDHCVAPPGWGQGACTMSDDFDLEQELLQVAGRSKAAGKKRSRKTAYSDSEGDDDLAGGFSEEEHDDLFGSDDDDDRPKSKKKPKAAAKRATKKRNASPSPEADGVASDGDEDEPQEKYPLEGKFIDEEDRARLMSMNELDRELELAQRQEEVDKMKQTMRLRQQAKAASRKVRGAAQGVCAVSCGSV